MARPVPLAPALPNSPARSAHPAWRLRGYAASDDIGIRVSFAGTLGVHHKRTVRTLGTVAIRRIGIFRAYLAVGSVTVHHGIHIAGSNTKIQIRLTQGTEGIGRLPVWLADNTNSETMMFQQAAYQGHAKAGVINIGITSDKDNVATIPAQRIHFGT